METSEFAVEEKGIMENSYAMFHIREAVCRVLANFTNFKKTNKSVLESFSNKLAGRKGL